jgi:hypothetical protein
MSGKYSGRLAGPSGLSIGASVDEMRRSEDDRRVVAAIRRVQNVTRSEGARKP